jgi:hypothetical protein
VVNKSKHPIKTPPNSHTLRTRGNMKDTLYNEVRFIFLTAVNMKNNISCDMSLCNVVELQPRFGRTYCFLVQGRKVKNEESFFDFKDGDSAFLRNFRKLLLDYISSCYQMMLFLNVT